MQPQCLIIVLGGGLDAVAWVKSGGGEARYAIGKSSALRALAASLLYKSILKSKILVSGGKTSPLPISEADAMKGYLTHDLQIDGEDILTEQHSMDTAMSVRCIVPLMQELQLAPKRIVLVSHRRHLERARRYFAAHGIRVEPVDAAKIIRQYLPQLEIDDDDATPGDARNEMLLSWLQLADRKGYLASAIRRLRRRA
jgi:uncharacterized SAM-binding protein YcdF (DUF218 family)